MRGVRRAALWLLGAGLAPGAGPLRAQAAGGVGVPNEASGEVVVRAAPSRRAPTKIVVQPAPSQQAPTEIVVRSAPSRRAPTEIVLGGREAARGAGTQGDPAKALQSLPGFGRGGPGGGELIAWGSSPAESRVFVDGVEVPALYHGDGVRSVVPASLVRDLRASPGAYGPAYGRALGGVVR
ncbi:MAG TPA: TonB-dependent receptor plug domain-containing protein, partial [Polyangiaceae bacterium]|nr:TonB-dependent receptor plug domain-containing protein [Polyangiaceae bacterium]